MITKIQNNKELFWNILGSIGVKGLAMVINIFSLPAYLHYFSDQKILGVWFAIISVLNWVLTFDLGIGNGLRNLLVKAYTENDNDKIQKYISSAYISIGGLSLLLGVIGYIIILNSNWNIILNISDNIISNKVLIYVIQIIFIGILIQLFLKLILSILYALQKSALSNLISLISNSLILVFLIIYKSDDIILSLKILAFVYVLTINTPLLIATFVIFSSILKDSKPKIKYFRKKYSSKILSLGTMFLGIQLSLLIINATNEILITRLYSPENVVEYQIYHRIFSIFLTLFSLLTIPIWSSVTKAYNENKIIWIRRIYKYLNIVSVAIGLVSIFTAFIFQCVVDIWLGGQSFAIDIKIALIFGTFNALMLFIYSSNCIANGITMLKPQLICNLVAAFIKIPLSIFLSNYFDNWSIIMIINILIMLPCIIVNPIAIKIRLK